MNSLAVKKMKPCFEATDIQFSHDTITLFLSDGRYVVTPIAKYPFLKRASKEQRENFEIFGEGTSIEWPDLGEFLLVEDIVMGYTIIDKKIKPFVDDKNS